MWALVKTLIAKSRLLDQAFGEIVFAMPEVKGSSSHSFFQWRIKKNMEGDQYFVALRMRPDAYAGPEGAPTNYINFDIETARLIQSDLARCISEYDRLVGEPSSYTHRKDPTS